MWYPAVGAVAVGVVRYFAPRTLGVGYSNISDILSGQAGLLSAIAFLVLMKLISWSISLGSGTSGGTLAPLFTIGSGLGALLGAGIAHIMPAASVDIRVAALIGMAAMFAGASRTLLASAVFAFETTLQPLGLLPLLGGCSAAFLISTLLMRQSIMTEKIARRGVRVPQEYMPDFLEQILVRDAVSGSVVSLRADDSVESARNWIASGAAGRSHQGFPVLDGQGNLVGVVTRRNLLAGDQDASMTLHQIISIRPIIVYDDATLREAADTMVSHNVGRLPVVSRRTGKLMAIVTRSDILSAHRHRLRELRESRRIISLPGWSRKRGD